ncbi:hypothetical protein [Streptomyces sp. OK228]|uniref:hypothetical protein n=1 Tax=Streptomyces sp. OK228 TaxID=1882786 RepID=UPI000BCAEC2B|nr:hypothetical protein [Streptomyces sp. OK228]SOE31806.1 hypothetical protein SAMN05442782_8740 [Streptomyces sp. OK228]
MSVEVRINQGALARLLRARSGPARRKLEQRTERVARIAVADAPGSMGQYITTDIQEGPRGLQGVITCHHPKVRLVLDGTRPHIIRPRNKRYLRFEVGGDVAFAKLVRHPGTRPNNFLARALRLGR